MRESMRCGLQPRWAKQPLINVQAETLRDWPTFKADLLRRRCLLPADGFYEWVEVEGKKQPHHVHRAGGVAGVSRQLGEAPTPGRAEKVKRAAGSYVLRNQPQRLVGLRGAANRM